MNKIKNIILFILNLIFPQICFICGRFLPHKNYTGFCVNCYKKLNLFHPELNPALKDFLNRSYIDSFNAPFIYSEEIANLILNFKFHDQEEKGFIIGKLLIPHLHKIPNYKNSLLVPVPLHKKRIQKRKFNQSTILARVLAQKESLKYSNKALKRIKNTSHQTGTSRSKRKKQLKNAFLADKNIVENKDIILIDDVFTTGSTANLCAQELKNKGAESVHVLTIAYTEK